MELEEYYKNKTVLITGGAGAIGSNLVARLRKISKSVIIVDDLSSGHFSNVGNWPNTYFRHGSIYDTNFLEMVYKDYKPNIVFHLASNFANQSSVDNPKKDLNTNGVGMLNVLDISKEYNVEKFVYTSSSCVYGQRGGKLKENMYFKYLETPYAITKLLGEYYCDFFYNYHKLPVVILRYFNIYGEGEYPGMYRNVIPNFIRRALREEPLVITGTGAETRSFCYVKDTISATIIAGMNDNAVGEVFNIGSNKQTKISDLANRINELTENPSGIEFVEARAWDKIRTRSADLKKAQKILGFKARTPLSTGLKNTIAWMKGKTEGCI